MLEHKTKQKEYMKVRNVGKDGENGETTRKTAYLGSLIVAIFDRKQSNIKPVKKIWSNLKLAIRIH